MSYWDTTNPLKPKGIKDPDAVLDYPIDFTDWLADISDTIDTFTVLVTGGLVWNELISSHSNGLVTVWLSGGTAGSTATFTVRVSTAGGRTDDRTFFLKIVDR